MNLDEIKSKLDSLQNNGTKEKKDYSKIFWKPEFGKSTVRIVPSAYNPDFPFTELKFHYNIGKYPMLALSNFGKQDPIEEFIKELKKTDDKDNWSLAGKLNPKTRIFAPVVVRGEEDKGVRLWGFGITIYKALLGLAEDEDIGDYTDVINGWDLVVNKVKGNPYPETSVRIKPKQSELSSDNNLVKEWLKEQPDPKQAHTEYDYEFIKKQLMSYLDPESDDKQQNTQDSNDSNSSTTKDSNSNTGQDLPSSLGNHKTDFTSETALEDKKDSISKFDELFKE
jgi:hypothetical protein